jgi:hypothetical protein
LGAAAEPAAQPRSAFRPAGPPFGTVSQPRSAFRSAAQRNGSEGSESGNNFGNIFNESSSGSGNENHFNGEFGSAGNYLGIGQNAFSSENNSDGGTKSRNLTRSTFGLPGRRSTRRNGRVAAGSFSRQNALTQSKPQKRDRSPIRIILNPKPNGKVAVQIATNNGNRGEIIKSARLSPKQTHDLMVAVGAVKEKVSMERD